MAQVDHNYGGPDALAYRKPDGDGIARADIRIFHKRDYDAGSRSARFLAARTSTVTGGRWAGPVELAPGDYIVVLALPRQYGPDMHELTVN